MGFPIRRFLDQSSFAAPQGISQRTTSFIASQRQGIHRMPLRHLIALMIDVRSAKTGHDLKKDLFLDCSKNIFLLAKHIRRSRLRAVAGSQGLGAPLAEYAASLRFQTSAHPTHKRGGANLMTRSIDPRPTDTGYKHNQDNGAQPNNGGACRDRTDDLKLAKLPLSQLS